MSNKKRMINVAKDRTYQNQSKDYYNKFFKWRADENNEYGYNFRQDNNEHSYVEGAGFLKARPETEERKALTKCLSLLGISMLVIVFIDACQYFIFNVLTSEINGNLTYFSDIKITENAGVGMTFLSGVMSCIRLLIPAIIFKSISKIPMTIAAPKSQRNKKFTYSAVIIMLVICAIGKIFNYIMAWLCSSFLSLDTIFSFISFSKNPYIFLINIILNCILAPIIYEFFFRGLVLQTFRQFDDFYAIVLTSIFSGLTYYDLPNIGLGITQGVVLSLFTIRTGSLSTAMIMSVSAHLFTYLTNFLSIMSGKYGNMIESCIFAFIVGLSILVYSKLMATGEWSFNIKSDPSQLSLRNKLKLVFGVVTSVLWAFGFIMLVFISAKVIR